MRFGSKRSALISSTAAALLAGLVPSADAAPIVYYRFEGAGFLNDSSGGGRTLTNPGGGASPTQYTLPASGAGSAFPDPVPLSGAPNAQAASFDGGDRFRRADEAAFTDNTFTAEAFFNGSDFATNASTKSLVGHWTATGSERSWLFGVGNTNFMSFLFSTGGGDTTTITSTLAVNANTDYYAAVAVDMGDATVNGIRFYLKDLTNDGPLLTNGQAHTAGTLHNSSAALTIGSTDQPSSGFTGVIDEVRVSDAVLTQSELLVPEPGSLALLAGVPVLVLGRRRRGRAV